MAAPSAPMVKVSVLHNLDQSRDEETWQKWWNGDLIPHLMPFALKLEIIRAEIYFISSSFKKQLQEDHLEHIKSGSPAGWDVAPYDAAVIYWTNDCHNVRNMITDPEWEGNIAKFVEGRNDTIKVDVQVGSQTTFINDSKVINNVPSDFMCAYLK